MNEQTIKLIEQLAQKLGTTTEYLWAVMVKQATVEIYKSILSIALFVLFSIFTLAYIKWASKNRESIYNADTEIVHYSACAICALITVFWFFGSINDIFTIITCLNNPEYWALEKVLNTVG